MRNVRKARRSLISGLGVAAVGVAFGSRPLAAQTASGGRFQPARHQQDGWLDAVAGKHRTFIDASTPKGAGEALLYANNLYEANKSGYTLPEADIVVVACMSMFEFTCQLATLDPPPPRMQQLLASIVGKQAAMDRFVQMNAGTISPAEFFSAPSSSAH